MCSARERFLAAIEQFSEEVPNMAFLRSAKAEFLAALEESRFSSFNDEHHMVMHKISSDQTFCRVARDRYPLALVFCDVRYCSNFTEATWRDILEAFPQFAALAVEHCLYVFDMSGADGLES